MSHYGIKLNTGKLEEVKQKSTYQMHQTLEEILKSRNIVHNSEHSSISSIH